jgi:hypothetical protein
MRYVLFGILIYLAACNSNSRTTETTDSLSVSDQEYSSYATALQKHAGITGPKRTFLKFQLGSTKKRAIKHIDSLIKAGTIERLSSLTFTMINVRVEGYPYSINLSTSDKIESLLIPTYENDTLVKVALFPIGEFSRYTLKEFLVKSYGEPAAIEKKDGEYTYYWFKDGYEIKYDSKTFGAIEYADPNYRMSELLLTSLVDSLQEHSKREGVKKTKEDFQ